ncbi:MAG: transcriptional regulator [Leptospiraceae bacterium]|nr:MAG: transcriptional regulator [Leptospiraceae bacterium]
MKIIQSHLIWINITLICIIILIHIKSFQKNIKMISNLLFLIGILCYHFYWLMLLYQYYSIIGIIFYTGMNLISYFFWLFSLSLFIDYFRINKFHIFVGILKFIVGNITLYLSYKNSPLQDVFLLSNKSYYYQIPNILFSFILILHSLYVAYKEKDSDLVILRIDVRKFHIFIIGIFIIWMFLYYLVFRPLSFTEIFNLMNAIAIMVLCIIFFLFGYPYLPLIIVDDKSRLIDESPQEYEFSQELLDKVIEMFEEKQIYKEEGLTIRKLAQYMNIQEYKLRNIINKGLGFKNFNDLLNTYRIIEAKRLLISNNKLSITRIALEVGYPNAAVFNRAFKQFTGITPSEYRKRAKKSDQF